MSTNTKSSSSFRRPHEILDESLGASREGLNLSKTSSKRSLKHFASHIVRKRKRRGVDPESTLDESIAASIDDSVSISSFDLSSPPETKRKKPGNLSRMTSLASVISTPMSKVGHALQRSISNAKLPPLSPSPSLNQSTTSLTPNKFFSRSFSTAQVSKGAQNGTEKIAKLPKVPDSPYGTLKRGGSGRASSVHVTPYRPPVPTPNKQRETRFWSSDFPQTSSDLKRQEVKHQEAIYEISCGEQDLVEDMKLVEKIYRDSLLSLKILTPSEISLIFGKFKFLPPLHVKLSQTLKNIRSQESGISRPIGEALFNWVQTISEPYVAYCGSLVESKSFLDARMQSDKDFSDFLQRCLESPFSRKLDLWSFLDVPRSRLVKYPLLIKQVQKFSDCPRDVELLSAAVHKMEEILKDVDKAMAQANCRHTIARLDWLDENIENMDAVKNAKEEMLEGTLKNNRGTKLECHLMDTVLILGRPVTRGNNGIKRLQVYRTPIPIECLVYEDLDGCFGHGSGSSTGSNGSMKVGNPRGSGSMKQGGSFKSAFSNPQSSKAAKHSFRVGFRDIDVHNMTAFGFSSSSKNIQANHTLIAKDEHSKRQWLTTLQKTVETYQIYNKCQSLQDIDEESSDSRSSSSILVGTPSTANLGKKTSRVALFQKNKRSPRIKASLSSATIESLKKGGGVKKLRSNMSHSNSAMKLTTASTSKLLRPARKFDENTPFYNKDEVKTTSRPKILQQSGASRKKLVNPELGGLQTRSLKSNVNVLKEQNNQRLRTKSWGHLWENVEASKENSLGQNYYNSSNLTRKQPRYLTRSKHKISKSMSDLLTM